MIPSFLIRIADLDGSKDLAENRSLECSMYFSRMLHVFFTLVAANNNVVPNTRRLFVCGLQVFCLALFHRKINLLGFFSNLEKAALTAMLLRTAYSSSIVFT